MCSALKEQNIHSTTIVWCGPRAHGFDELGWARRGRERRVVRKGETTGVKRGVDVDNNKERRDTMPAG